MKFGNFELSIIRESTFRLDGGALFGVVPKTLWGRTSTCDEMNRVLLSCNLLLIKTPEITVLVETGMGTRWSEPERKRYDLTSLVDQGSLLASVGLQNVDVDVVILSHLHFDHAGGAVMQMQDMSLAPAFPNASYYVQKGEWEFAHKANARARGSYRQDDFLPLEHHGVLKLLDGDSEVCPGVRVHVTGGHTCHHQIVLFESNNSCGVYFADIIPTKSHLQPPWVMGYDHFPLDSCDVKTEYLTRAANENWLVVFDHELDIPWGHVSLNDKGKFLWHPLDEC